MSEGRPFGVVLRRLRQQAGLTIEELAEASGVSVRAIGDMERGHSRAPQRRTVAALVEGLGPADADRESLLAAARAGRRVSGAPVEGVPRSTGHFTGRDAELTQLREAADRAGSAGVAPVVVVSGPPGCGKTSLALKAVAKLAQDFPGGCFVVNLQGVDGPVQPAEALLKLLSALGVSDRQLAQQEPHAQGGLVRALLAERRCLVVLDDACDEGQVRPLLPSGGSSLVLVTSRRPLSGLENVDRLALAELPKADAVELLRRIVGAERTDAEPEAVARVAELCGHLPLALRVAGKWLAVRSAWSVEHMVGRLADEERRLAALTAGDVGVKAAFELSYRQLTAQAARMLRLLSLVTGPDMTAAYGASLTSAGLFEAEEMMEELVEAGLLQTTHTGRYQLHDLLRLFARNQLSHEADPDECAAARERLHSWLLDTATAASRWVTSDQGAPPPPWQGLTPLRSAEEARSWLEAEATAWFAALRGAAGQGEHARVVDTAEALYLFADLRPFWGHWPEVYHLSSQAAAALGDPRLEAIQRTHHSWALEVCEHRHREALEQAEEALECARQANDIAQQAEALVSAAHAHSGLGEAEESAEKTLVAADLLEAVGHHEGWLTVMTHYRHLLRQLGRVKESVALHGRIMAVLDGPDRRLSTFDADRVRITATCGLGRDYAALGRWQEAVEQYRSGLLQAQRSGYDRVVGPTLLELAAALTELGQAEQARSCLHQLLGLGQTAEKRDLTLAQERLDALHAESEDHAGAASGLVVPS